MSSQAEWKQTSEKKLTFIKGELFQSKRSVFSQHCFSSLVDLHERPQNKLSDLEQNYQTIKDCIESAERAVENMLILRRGGRHILN